MTTLARALSLWQRGLGVIPVPKPDGRFFNGKVPKIAWRDYQSRLQTEDEIRAWFATEQNLAIVTGAISGVVVVDLDSPQARRWFCARFPYTPWQTRTGQGWHLFYQHPDVLVRNRARIETCEGKIAIDVRGDGGYVIAPGSIHANGTEYAEAGDWSQPRDALARFWPGWLARSARPGPPRPAGRRPTGDVIERARKYLAAIPRPEIGAGSDVATLSAACRLVRGFAISASDATALLWEWAGGRPGWTPDWIAQKVDHAIRYGTEPVGGLVS